MVVGAEEIQRRIEQARAEQADVDGIGAVLGAESARAEAGPRLAGFLQTLGNADLAAKTGAALEEAQDVARLRELEAGQGIEIGDNALETPLILGRRRIGLHALRRAVHAVALTEARPLLRKRAIVVKRGAPKHAAVRHHVHAILKHFLLMTARRAA